METITFNDLKEIIKNYNEEEIEKVEKAYEFANKLHEGQFRQSGEPYISHPLAVTKIVAEMKADSDTLCAGLLHDVVEDTDTTIKEIEELFNKEIAVLVDGVTKISRMNFSSKEEMKDANTRKIVTGISKDVRIIIIKLADRLHNMRTLQFKNEFKQKENSLETMEIFVPLAYYIGAYRIKSELEDISLRYLKPCEYNEIEKKMAKVKMETDSCLNEMVKEIHELLLNENIPFEIKKRTKNIYGVYKQLMNNKRMCDIHDLLALKIMVDDVRNCYYTLGLIHSKYPPINGKFKDFICQPKTNMYQSLHTTVFSKDENLVQTQIRTFDMDKIASFGLTAYWDINKGEARKKMQKDLENKYQFFKSLNEINVLAGDNQEFVNTIKKELFTNNIYVYSSFGEIIELPQHATAIDYACKMGLNIIENNQGILVNGQPVSLDYKLKNNDIIKVVENNLVIDVQDDLIEKVNTLQAKQKIKKIVEGK
ncbi:MAG: bifunctional (p)ppGpp synthetase/guanosine-3',5'-bis(diphosphate) 3'-pyrophosphohydrolase [Bacilli bacterium]|nr:bifunctional (p)ppGpp synthetase/guanosine-3',5'-bis(diphosphate) 3'-pyrophosphohydrolase [Bacilli bacterium]